LEGKKPNRTKNGWFEPVFGSVKKIKKKIILIWLFILIQIQTELKMFILFLQSFAEALERKGSK